MNQYGAALVVVSEMSIGSFHRYILQIHYVLEYLACKFKTDDVAAVACLFPRM